MRVVLDANVLVSAILTPGGEAEAIRKHVEDHFVLLVTCSLFAELERVLRYPRLQTRFPHLSDEKVTAYVASLRERGEQVNVATQLSVASDPDDNHVLALAVDGQADYLVTRNTSHFPPSYAQVKVLSPDDFLKLVRQQEHRDE